PLNDSSTFWLPPSRGALREEGLTVTAGNPLLVSHDQMQSTFFTKLPFDLRYLIYKEVLPAGWTLTVSGLVSALRTPRVLVESKAVARHQHGRDTVWHVATVSGLCYLLPLLKTCRRMYASFPILT